MKISVAIFFILILFGSTIVFAGNVKSLSPCNNFKNIGYAADTIDQKLFAYAKNTPSNISQDIDQLTDYLKQSATNKRDIVKAFSYWIMQNISYDIDGFFNNAFNTEGVTGTLKTRKGICQDYSELFKAMCDRADIKCYIISGYAKGFQYNPVLKFDKSNHAWNIVWLDNRYVLMDLTWSSGSIMYADNSWQYFSKPDTSALFTAPEIFVEKHLPTDPVWQLLNHPVSMNSFLRSDDHKQMMADSSQYYNFMDSISMLEQLDTATRELKSAEDSYSFYPVQSEYAFHYYHLAISYSNTASDYYNAAVNAYNKAVANSVTPKATDGYNETGITNAINYYNKAIQLLKKISNYSDSQIRPDQLLPECYKGVEYSTDLLKTLK